MWQLFLVTSVTKLTQLSCQSDENSVSDYNSETKQQVFSGSVYEEHTCPCGPAVRLLAWSATLSRGGSGSERANETALSPSVGVQVTEAAV